MVLVCFLVFDNCWNFRWRSGCPQALAGAPLSLAGERLWGTRVRSAARGLAGFRPGSWFASGLAVEDDAVGPVT